MIQRGNLKQQTALDNPADENDSNQPGKTIKVTPDEIIFSQVVPSQIQVENVTLTNTLGAPVDLVSTFPEKSWRALDLKMFEPRPTRSHTQVNQTCIRVDS